MQLLVDNRSDSTKMHVATIRLIRFIKMCIKIGSKADSCEYLNDLQIKNAGGI